MIVKTLIAAIVMVAIVMLALGVKLLFDKNAEFTSHSCALDINAELDKEETCAKCDLKDIVQCPESDNDKS
jgi:Na+-transporting NADH:ubiquinone oxidoreductase subunit NqrF